MMALSKHKFKPSFNGRKPLIALLVISLIAGTGALQVWKSSAAVILPNSTNLRSYDTAIHDRINAIRINYDRKPLRESYGCLQNYAKQSAERMAAARSMTHATNLKKALSECNVKKVGENIAVSSGWSSTDICRAWFNSDTHRRNMLDRDFNVGAVYTVRGGDGKFYTASWFAQT